jgi:two-component system CheB/CheR fusion protein
MEQPLGSLLDELRLSPVVSRSFEFEHRIAGDPPRGFQVRGGVLNPDGETFLLVTIEEITAHREVERLLSLERERLAGEVESTARELGRTQSELRALAASLFTSQEDERRRVARELHDDICQRLAALEIDARQIEPRIAGAPQQAREDVEKLGNAVSALSDEVRRISHTLHPSAIDDLGIAPALRALVSEFRQREQMIATFTARDVPDHLPPATATGLYRIAQEALRNVAKHAGKTHVKVLLAGSPQGIRLQISDSGEGFQAAERRAGLGLISMEERARLIGGRFAIESKPGEGTRVTVEVPAPTP